jgi:DNA polymerase I-like protein with 3'-5' exonuclease and polymerase domains
MVDLPKQAEDKGYVDTLFGFRRDIYQNDDTRKTHWANQALNTPIQGSAHQLVLMAMAILDQKPKTYNRLQTPVMEIHDSLYFFTKLRYLQEANRQIKQLLEHDVVEYAVEHFGRRLKVPLIAETKAGFCMGSMVEYEGMATDVFLSAWRKKHREVERTSWDKLIPGFSKIKLL